MALDLVKYKKRKAIVYICAFVMDLTLGVFLVIAPLRLDALAVATGANRAVTAGVMGLVFILVRLSLHLAVGHLSDRIGRKALLLLATAFQVSAFAVVFFSTSAWHLLPAYVLSGLFAAVFWPTIEGWMSEDSEGADLLHAIGTFNIAFSMGLAIGPFMVFALRDAGYRTSSVIAVALCLVNAVLILWRPHVHPRKIRETVTHEPHPLFNPSFRFIAFVANVAAWTIVGQQRFLFPAMARSLGFSEQATAGLLAVFYGGFSAAFVLLKFWHGWQYRLWALLAFQGVGILGLIGIATLPPSAAVLVPCLILTGLSIGKCYVSSMFYALDGVDAKGAGAGAHETFLAVGMLIGVGLNTVVAAETNFRWPYLILAGLVALAIGVECVLCARSRARNSHG